MSASPLKRWSVWHNGKAEAKEGSFDTSGDETPTPLRSLLIHIRKEVRKGTPPNMKKRPPQGLMGIRGMPQPVGRSSIPAKGKGNGEPVRRATIDPMLHSPYSV